MQPVEMFSPGCNPLPIMRTPVRTRLPSPADAFVVEEKSTCIANRPATFLVRVGGDSMLTKQLHHGDLAVVDRSGVASPEPWW